MFTGLILEIGKVINISEHTNSCVLEIDCQKVLESLEIGVSVAVNGLCLTVTNIFSNSFTADIMPVSIEKSALKNLKISSFVNLEPAMQMKSRFGGHFVSGHIDGVAEILDIYATGNSHVFQLQLSKESSKFLIPEGSISIDGISLTIAKLDGDICDLSIIPHTFQNTILKDRKIGDIVNIETDLIGKYIYNFMNKKKSENINMDFLSKNGFI